MSQLKYGWIIILTQDNKNCLGEQLSLKVFEKQKICGDRHYCLQCKLKDFLTEWSPGEDGCIRCIQVDARKATTAELQTVHSADYVALIQGISSKSRGRQRLVQKRYDSIYFGPGSSESALLAAGSVIEVSNNYW